MFKQITDLAGNEYYLIASLIIFLIFFISVIVYVVTMKKSYISEMENMPFIDDKQTQDYEKV